ncbi:MFS transporter [Rhodoblastus acidophilus]|uniref:MFS transporter n=1 Tax=Candidatus Rhodoblastus alkanivorans TaxID=2954117 RepID=A0ABS9Z8Y5_9HYPH|nr:MFS transporter [Candidatus Rhodoblastus alkanivorans]MCI4678698.1 MFS transporter [Candidatus Rhodoblastus alkanivorans]MCI4683506.1 MFS transporter [Candidatus Rhodoblastus alkanivorans]MDI4640821.1 MFS transporter [Rhodoblastus acidophilus]
MHDRSLLTRPGSARRNVLLFLIGRGLVAFASQMLAVALGWQVYASTGSALTLGFVGLAQFLPLLVLLRWSGAVADHFDRRKVASFAALGQAAASLAIFAVAAKGAPVWMLYPALFALGSARAFAGPANSALLPEIVDTETFPRAVAMSTTVFQMATIAGPALGGLLFAAFGLKIFPFCAALALGAAPAVWAIRRPEGAGTRPELDPAQRDALAGLRYIWSNKVVLGAISLDLFAVLFGGATALLPIFAHDILHVGPQGLGILRAAPAAGAVVVSLVLTTFPLRRGAGRKMFVAVAGYALATVVFALSTSFQLSLAAMAALGAFDVVSMVVRQTLIQLATPNEMRGRVSAVNFVFIGASNQLGEFESGVAAAIIGPVGAALFGGCAALVVAAVWAAMFPQLRKADAIGG